MESVVGESGAPVLHYYPLCLARRFKQDMTSDPGQVGLFTDKHNLMQMQRLADARLGLATQLQMCHSRFVALKLGCDVAGREMEHELMYLTFGAYEG